MKVFLTGANGLLGHNILKILLDRGYFVNVIVRRADSLHISNDEQLRVYEGSFLDEKALQEAMNECTAVIHAAGCTDMSASYDEFKSVNVDGSRILIEVSRRKNVSNIVFISTANTIGYGSPLCHSSEDAPIQYPFSDSSYAMTKRQAEQLFIEESFLRPDTHIVILNPGFMLGAYDSKPSSGALLRAAYRRPLMLAPCGGKCFIHVSDVAAAAVDALKLGESGKRYMLGNYNMSIADYYRLQRKVLGYRQCICVIPRWIMSLLGALGDLVCRMGLRTRVTQNNLEQLCVMEYYDNTRAVETLKLAKTPLETAIIDCAGWMKMNNML